MRSNYFLIVLGIILSVYIYVYLPHADSVNPRAGDASRYLDFSEYVVQLWSDIPSLKAPESLAKFLPEFLIQPIAPMAEKPLFFWEIGICKLLLGITGIAPPDRAIIYLNLILFLGVVLLTALIIRKLYDQKTAVLATVLLSTNFDLFFYALNGYYSLCGLFFLIFGIYFRFSTGLTKNSHLFWLGVLYSLSLLASPGCMPAWIGLFLFELYVLWSWRPPIINKKAFLLIIGGLSPFIYTLIADLVRLLLDIPSKSYFSLFLFQSHQAREFGSVIPIQPLYYFEYLSAIHGIPYIVFFLFAYIFLLFRVNSFQEDKKYFLQILLWISVLTYTIFTFFGFPAIARIFSVLSLIGPILIAIFFLGLPKKNIAISFLTYGLVLLFVSHQVYHFWGMLNPKTASVRDQNLVSLKGPIYPAPELSFDRFKGMLVAPVAPEGYVTVVIGSKFTHSAFINCELEMYLSRLIDLGLRPAAVEKVSIYEPINFLNEYGYYGLVKGRGEDIWPEYVFLKHFKYDHRYYFSLEEIYTMGKRYPSIIAGVSCPQRLTYASPGLPLAEKGVPIRISHQLGANKIIAYWKMGDIHRPIVRDKVGGNNGKLFGTPSMIRSMGPGSGKTIRFNGVDNYIRVPNAHALDLTTNQFSIEIWAKWADTLGEQVLVEKFSAPKGPGWTLTKLANNHFQFYGCGLGPCIDDIDPGELAADEWRYIVLTRYDNSFTFYFDGRPIKQSLNKQPIIPTDEPLYIGRRNNGRGFYFNGWIAGVRIWEGALTADEVSIFFRKELAKTTLLSPQ